MVQLDVSKIKKNAGEELHLNVECDLQSDQSSVFDQLIINGPLKLDLFTAYSDNTIKVSGRVEGDLKLVCSRCLELFDMTVSTVMNEVYYDQTQLYINPDEEWVPFKGEKLNITPEVVKSLFCFIPMKPVCHPECRGLCQSCGANLNLVVCECSIDDVDPRLVKLKKLLD